MGKLAAKRSQQGRCVTIEFIECPGTGRGLAIQRKILENQDGFIVAEGKEGRGATFHCYCPVE